MLIILSLPISAFAIDLNHSSDLQSETYDECGNVIKDVYEVVNRREEAVKHFKLEDGSYTAVQYDVPVHYLDNNNNWQDIDNTLLDMGNEYSTNTAKIKFAKKITGNNSLFTINDGSRKLTMSLVGAKKNTNGNVSNTNTVFDDSATKLQKMMTLDNLSSRIIYSEILDGVDLEYVLDSVNVKENIIVKTKQDSYSYSFNLKLNNLLACLSTDGNGQTEKCLSSRTFLGR